MQEKEVRCEAVMRTLISCMLISCISQSSSKLSLDLEEGYSSSGSDSLKIEGGYPLQGVIKIDGAKNSVLPLMAAVLLTDESLILTNVPDIVDVRYMLKLLAILDVEWEETINEVLGSWTLKLRFKGNATSICATLRSRDHVKKVLELSTKFRASYFVLGPLVGRFGVGILAHSGGCDLGSRPTNFHVEVMRAFGANIKDSEGFQKIFIPMEHELFGQTNGVKKQDFGYRFPNISVGATINAILVAVTRGWTTLLSNCAVEPEVIDLCMCLRKMGAKIDIKARAIHIVGVKLLKSTTHRIIPDRIEAGTFMIAAAATKGNVTLVDIENPYPLVGSLGDLLRQTGSVLKYGETYVQVNHSSDGDALRNDIDLRTAPEIRTSEYPGFPTDLQPQMLALLSGWDGVTNCRIVENIFDDRFKMVSELQKMGAEIEIVSPREVIIKRGKRLHGVTVVASNLRNAAALCIAGLIAAKGEVTIVKDVHHLDRGYASFEEKLRNCGARIQRVHNNVKDNRYCPWQSAGSCSTCLANDGS